MRKTLTLQILGSIQKIWDFYVINTFYATVIVNIYS
jgi:hypothetical protein